MSAAAYIAADISGRWPTDADTRQIAHAVAQQETELVLDEGSVYDYLSGPVLGFKPLTEALGSDTAATTLPVLVTASMLFTFRPKGKKWWEYLDQIWGAYEKAETMDVTVLPALQVRAKMLKATGMRPAPTD